MAVDCDAGAAAAAEAVDAGTLVPAPAVPGVGSVYVNAGTAVAVDCDAGAAVAAEAVDAGTDRLKSKVGVGVGSVNLNAAA